MIEFWIKFQGIGVLKFVQIFDRIRSVIKLFYIFLNWIIWFELESIFVGLLKYCFWIRPIRIFFVFMNSHESHFHKFLFFHYFFAYKTISYHLLWITHTIQSQRNFSETSFSISFFVNSKRKYLQSSNLGKLIKLFTYIKKYRILRSTPNALLYQET